jgi:immune inhibitor A
MRTFLIALLSTLLVSPAIFAVPPSREAIDQLIRDGLYDSYRIWLEQVRNDGWDQPGVNVCESMRNLERDDQDQITLRVPVILIDFADTMANRNVNTTGHYRQVLFQAGTRSVRDYFIANSYNEVNVVGEVYGWVQSQYTRDFIGNNDRGFTYSRTLVQEAMRLVDNQCDFAGFDNNGDGVVECVVVVHQGIGNEAQPGDDNLIHSHCASVGGIRLDGVSFYRYTINPEPGGVPVFGHELGHGLFGLPDLYDGDTSAYGMGDWSMMAEGPGRNLDAWCKIQCGWVTPIVLTRNRWGVRIPSAGLQPVVYKIDMYPDNDRQYFLLENRRQRDFDDRLPGHGLIIYHIDDAKEGNNNEEWYPGLNPREHKTVAVEQADGNWDLDHKRNEGDSGDPFPGNTNNQSFTPFSTPSSIAYGLGYSDISIENIREDGDYIICDMLNGVQGRNLMMDSVVVTPERVLAGRPVSIRYKIVNDGNLNADSTYVRLALSRDRVLSDDDIILRPDQAEGRSAEGTVIERIVERTIPQETVPGSYNLLAVVDFADRLQEIDEIDNTGSFRLMIGGEPNLTLPEVTVSPRFVRPNQEMTISVRVANIGGLQAGEFDLEFFLSRDSIRSPDDQSLGNRESFDGLAANQSVERQVIRRAPAFATPGYYQVLALLDRQNRVREIDEFDNNGMAPVTIPGPNLVIFRASVEPDTVRPGTEVTVTTWFTNRGLIDAPISNVGYALSRDPILSNNDRTLGDIPPIDSIGLGDTLLSIRSRIIPEDQWWGGTGYIVIKCDAFGRIPEMLEEDNYFAIPVTIVGNGVDPEDSDHLSPYTMLYPPNPNPFNSTVTISYNLSTKSALSALNVSIFDLSGRLVERLFTGHQPAGEHSLVWNAEGVRAGVYLIRLEGAGRVEARKVVLVR